MEPRSYLQKNDAANLSHIRSSVRVCVRRYRSLQILLLATAHASKGSYQKAVQRRLRNSWEIKKRKSNLEARTYIFSQGKGKDRLAEGDSYLTSYLAANSLLQDDNTKEEGSLCLEDLYALNIH